MELNKEGMSEVSEKHAASIDATLEQRESPIAAPGVVEQVAMETDGTESTATTKDTPVIEPQPSNSEQLPAASQDGLKNISEKYKEQPMDTSSSDQPLDMSVTAGTFTQAVPAPSLEMQNISSPSILQTKPNSGISVATKLAVSQMPVEPVSKPASDDAIVAAAPAQPKPVSIFASLFPTPTTAAKPSHTPQSRTPIPLVEKLTGKPAETIISGEKLESSEELAVSGKSVKSELIADAEVSFPEVSDKQSRPTEAKIDKTGSTGELLKRASPLPTQIVTESSTQSAPVPMAEKMDIDPVQAVEPAKPAVTTTTTRAKSISPNIVTADTKSVTKHPPIGGKTIKKEQRKNSNSSPTIPGEPKKAQRTKSTSPKTKKKRLPPKEDIQDGRNDFYCWVCHKEGEVLCCELCPRVFHAKCLNMAEEPEGDWFCPECEKITDAECKETQSRAMSLLTIEQFSLLLKYVIQRMKIPLSEAFHDPVDTKMFPDYRDYVFHPMDLSTIEKNVKKKKYGCPEAFLGEFQWVVHNCVIYNSPHSKLTQTAKAMVKVAERELNEIEVCPECYLNSCRKRENWFCEPCKELHPLVWAKLQGFPHWPAKALRIEKGLVDVRFFGQHDRAWIPLSGCYLISKELPLPIKNKKKSKGPGLRGGLDGAMQEMQGYIENIKKITGEFEYAPPRTLLTHCDLYRKTTSAKSNQSKQQGEESKSTGTSAKTDTTDIKAKVELKDIGATKELSKIRPVGLTTPKKGKMVTTSGEHPTRSFATKKKRASMEFLSKTIESCKASLGIEKIQDVKMNSGSEDSSSSSEDEDVDTEMGKSKSGENADKDVPSTSGTQVKKLAAEDDDSDSELIIDLGDMDDSAETATKKNKESPVESGAPKPSDGLIKKRKPEDFSNKPTTSKPPIKSILLNAPKPTDKDERKKMLAKALSEKIGGKRKHDVEGASPGTTPSTKIRKTIEQQEKRGNSPSEVGQKKMTSKDKDWKKSHYAGKYLEKEGGKVRPGILKSSADSGQRKDGYSSEKRVSDTIKSKQKDGSQKSILKKTLPPEKSGRMDKIPTEADTRKLFNGGRIPRKNPVSTVSDEEQDHNNNPSSMETNQPIETRKSNDNVSSNPRNATTRQTGFTRQTSVEPQRQVADENITLASLKKYSDKVMDTVQKVFYEMYTDLMVPLTSNSGSEASTAASATAMHEVAQMRLELERLKWMHEQEIAELKHNHDLTVAEIRESLEYEKKQLLLEAKVQDEAAKNRAVEETKRKQWCAYCNKEAIFYCCWNTSYCDYPCQQKHWPQHMNSCTQARDNAASTQNTASEPMLSPPVQSLPTPQMLSSTSATLLSQSAKPAILSTVSPGRTTITISANPGNISRLSSSGKSTIILPSSVSLSVTKPSLKSSIAISADSSKSQVSVPKAVVMQQQKSGFAISAIGARLLAAKQRSSGGKEQSATPSRKSESETTATPSTQQTSETSQPSEDHVIATMESPLSPDAKPPSPKKTSLLVSAEKSVKVKKEDKPDVKEPQDTKLKPLKAEIEPDKATTIQTAITEPIKPITTAVTSTTITETKASSSLAPKTTSKPHNTFSKAFFSSPSAVASLIADMGTPLSSTLSSPESSSFSDTPEKKTEVPKVQLSLDGSAFSKVVSSTSKPPSAAPTTVVESTSVLSKDMPSNAQKTAEVEEITDSAGATDKKAIESNPVTEPVVPVVAPVLADSYLTGLHKTLPPKTKTPPPVEMMEEDPPTTKPQLPRPVLPESDEDKSITLDPKISDSDTGDPMETDN